MTASRDPDRLIQAFLAEGRYELADRVYDVIRDDIDRTRQRVVIGPWRIPDMLNFAKIAIAAAAVVVVAVVGVNLFAGPNNGVGGGPTEPPPTATPAPTPSPSAVPTPIPTEAGFAPSGPLALGRHTFTSGGLRFSVDVQTAGWVSNGQWGIDYGSGTNAGAASFIFWRDAAAVGVFSDPCTSTRGPAIGASPAELAAAVAALPGTDLVQGPADVTVGGFPAKQVTITIRDDIACSPRQFSMWWGPGSDNFRYASARGSTVTTWIVDVSGKIAWIDGETYQGAGPGPRQELQQIVDSIQFE